jgi:hypothetical protein
LFGGQVQGFWAFDVDPQEVALSDSFLRNIRDFGGQIAELLYHRHQWQQQRDAETRIFHRLFRLEAVKVSSQEVSELLDLLDNRLHAIQAVFNGLATASIHYDLFGRVIQLNSSMERFMQEQDLPGYELTALDLLMKLAGMPQQQARRLLQQVVIDRRDFYIPVSLQGSAGQSYSVHVKPLTAPEMHESFVESSTTPFELAGILFELSDEKGLKKRYETKQQLLEWMRLRIERELHPLLAELPVNQPRVSASSDELLVSMGLAKVAGINGPDMPHSVEFASRSNGPTGHTETGAQQVLAVLQRLHDVFARDWDALDSRVQPVDLYPLIMRALDQLSSVAQDKRIHLDAKLPRLMGLVNAQPDQLLQLLTCLLQILLDDAAAASEVKIRVRETQRSVVLRFANTGFGLPDEHLQAYLWQPEYGVTEEFKELRQALQPVGEWGGEIHIHSEVGVGIWARLRMQVIT